MEKANARRTSSPWLAGSSTSTSSLLFLLVLSIIVGSHQTVHARSVLRSNDHGNKSTSSLNIRLETRKHHDKVVIMDNGLVELTFSNPRGDIIGIKYNGIDNLLEIHNHDNNKGYWDTVWANGENEKKVRNFNKLEGTKFEITKHDTEQIEISFSKPWSNKSSGTLPMNVDKRYVMLRDYPGFYTYGIFEHPKEAPAAEISELRVALKLQQDKFEYMALSDDIQRIMPSAEDRLRGNKLAYPEAVLLTNPSNPKLRGEVDDKYQYSKEQKDNKVHGWMSTKPWVGLWIITPSIEFLAGGPTKQELTSHVGPTALSVFLSCHYVGEDMIIKLGKGESWKKVFGPIPVYLNSANSDQDNHQFLWANAKAQAEKEAEEWPYNFVRSEDFPSVDQRGIVRGQLLVRDRYINERLFEAASAYVGLAAPGAAGSWQRETKRYQFWIKADEKGYFTIKNIRLGIYNLYAFVPGIIGDYVYEKAITIEAGSIFELGNIIYEPPRNGPTLWEIGVADRTASEFYVPDPLPTLSNRVLVTKPENNFRQYGLWDRYTDLYPNQDLVYTVGQSDYRRDWFFAHVTRNEGNWTYRGTTWRVVFVLGSIAPGSYTLRVAVASAAFADLQVRFNDPSSDHPALSTSTIGRDNAIARHGIHGLYTLYSVDVPSNALREGNNTLYLTQPKGLSPFVGLMYDYIRFEAPPQQH